jgi:hypothetical protein
MENAHPHPIIIIKDVKYEDIRNIIRFIYTGEVSVPQHELQESQLFSMSAKKCTN